MTRGSKEKLALEICFYIVCTISQSIGAFHADRWVHKSHAIKFFFDKKDDCDLRNPYLTDFKFSRPVAVESRLIGQASDPERDSQLKYPSPSLIRKIPLGDSGGRLRHRMGSAYKYAVVLCFSDEFNNYLEKDDFAMTFQKLIMQNLDIKKLLESPE